MMFSLHDCSAEQTHQKSLHGAVLQFTLYNVNNHNNHAGAYLDANAQNMENEVKAWMSYGII